MKTIQNKISQLKQFINKIDYKITQTENETLQKIFDKIKKDKEYRNIFFKANWELILICSELPEGDEANSSYYEGEEFSNIYKIYCNTFKNFPQGMYDICENIFFLKKDTINVLKQFEYIDEYYNGCYIYKFNQIFISISKFYFEKIQNKKLKIKETLNECKKCKYYSICKNQEKCRDLLGEAL